MDAISSTSNRTFLTSAYSTSDGRAVSSSQDGDGDSDVAVAAQSSLGSQSARVTISEEALRKAGLIKDELAEKSAEGKEKSSNTTDKSAGSADKQGELKPEEQRQVDSLKQRDGEVRAHEMAHMMAGGSLVLHGASYSYATGPDGKRYAVGGEVSIDTSPVHDDPKATALKMQHVQRAALAPAQPSSQDRSVAASAAKAEAEAHAEERQQSSKT
jgi:hypothetical protein